LGSADGTRLSEVGSRTEGTGQWLSSIGLPAGFAALAGTVEFFGGLALLLGILTPIIAGLVALWMLSTTWLSVAKINKKFVGVYELDILLELAALALAAIGGGAFSVDHLLGLQAGSASSKSDLSFMGFPIGLIHERCNDFIDSRC
jgi:putative oxidoreductase